MRRKKFRAIGKQLLYARLMDQEFNREQAVWEVFGIRAELDKAVASPVDESLLRELYNVETMLPDRFQLAVEMLSQHVAWRDAYRKMLEADCGDKLNCDPTPNGP